MKWPTFLKSPPPEPIKPIEVVRRSSLKLRLEEWRKKGNFPPIGRMASYVQTATAMGLGNSDMSHIEVKHVRQ